ncbi:hypothetical protein M011DRAFT_470104 [Sporormia fimetaria CBS 119925]|uniref:Uncharacterized protein n=1 Tax=Sporormia fimetaria CBS 119925 TaxID=1340428 RepID=A0A6A6V501_9PLEO|nr:hypothetical protein M011DRAFT_470104 [Sporormia fimetaria CBS 119925]
MPEHRGISLALHSQFDIETLPEYFPAEQTYDSPPYINDKASTVSVFIPVFPGSQFWLSYVVNLPLPDEQCVFFKLFIDGAHVVSWSCGKKEDWKGKTVFGLFEKVEEDGKRRVEKRVLCFASPGEGTGNGEKERYLEVKVFRARARKRIPRVCEEFEGTGFAKNGGGISLVNAGKAGGAHPKRFYKFALIDPLDQPYASFRYHYRTWDQPEELGIVEKEGDVPWASDYSEAITWEEEEEEEDTHGKGYVKKDELEDVFAPLMPQERPAKLQGCFEKEQSDGHHGLASPSQGKLSKLGHIVCPRRFSPKFIANRLSVPPSVRLSPPKRDSSRPLPMVPWKKGGVAPVFVDSSSHDPNEWRTRTPSPVKVARERLSSPSPSPARKHGVSLGCAVPHGLKRHGNAQGRTSGGAGGRLDAGNIPWTKRVSN